MSYQTDLMRSMKLSRMRGIKKMQARQARDAQAKLDKLRAEMAQTVINESLKRIAAQDRKVNP